MSLTFYIVNAFTTDSFRGNPAAVVFIDDLQDTALMQNIAKNLNQPMTAFLRRDAADAQSADEPQTATFDVRWFTAQTEAPLCGHATIASSGLMFSVPGLIPPTVQSIVYRTKSGLVLTTKKAGEWIELSMVAAQIHEFSAEKTAQYSTIVSKALGKEVHVKFAGEGLGPFAIYAYAEIDVEDDLAGCVPKPLHFLESDHIVNVITSSSPDPHVSFLSRMFAPEAGVPEDHVCGSAHCLLTPYWAGKLEKGGVEMSAKQVSTRGGDIRAAWREAEGHITLSGQIKITTKGDLLL
ncbi:Diaminopimelate epimerase-like protein [Trametopsis cervina]|nr:Diaminopimelate epimerase-like protein [Trametopsis cervina]